MNVKYGLLLKKSFLDLKENLVVFLPLLFALLFVIIGIMLVAIELVIAYVLGLNLDTNLIVLISLGILFLLIDLVLFIYLRAIISAMYINLVNVVVTRKKANYKDLSEGIKKYTKLCFEVSMVKLSIILIPLLGITILVGLGFLVSKWIGIILAIMLGTLFILQHSPRKQEFWQTQQITSSRAATHSLYTKTRRCGRCLQSPCSHSVSGAIHHQPPYEARFVI